MTADNLDLVLVNLLAGDIGVPGAPVLQIGLTFRPESGALAGQGLITQPLPPPLGHMLVRDVRGTVHALGSGPGPLTRVFALAGEIDQPLPPPAIGTVTEKFNGVFMTDNNWKGHCSFSYGTHQINNVPIALRR